MAEKENITLNFNTGLEIIQNEYKCALARFKEMDSKFNTLLVFVAGEIAAFGALFSVINAQIAFKIAFAVVFFTLLLTAIITNFIGLFTKYIELINTDSMLKESLYKIDNISFFAKFIATYHNCINCIEEKIRKKSTLFNVSLIFVILSLLAFCIFIVVYLFL